MRFKWATREFVKPDMSVPWLGEPDDHVQSPVTTASKTAEPGVTDKDLADTTVMCIPLNLKHCTASSVKFYQQASGRFAMNQNPKRTKVQEYSKCDRMIEFGDLQDHNRCFAVIFRDARQSQNMLRNFLDVILLGMPIMIGLPKTTTTRVARLECPVLESNDALVPCTEWPDNLEKLFPSVELKAPDTPGQMVCAIQHGTKIDVSRFRYVKGHNVSCKGRLCDRSRAIASPNVHCGCIFNQCDNFDCVAEMTITLPVPHHINTSGKLDIDDFRSLRFTELIIDDHTAFQKSSTECFTKKYTKHSRAVNQLVEHVNDNGGWTFVVWFRKGEIRDASSQEAMVENYDTKLHLVLLVPTNPVIRNHNDKEFENLRLKPESQEKRNPSFQNSTWFVGRAEMSLNSAALSNKGAKAKKHKKHRKERKHKNRNKTTAKNLNQEFDKEEHANARMSNQNDDEDEEQFGEESDDSEHENDDETGFQSHFEKKVNDNSEEDDQVGNDDEFTGMSENDERESKSQKRSRCERSKFIDDEAVHVDTNEDGSSSSSSGSSPDDDSSDDSDSHESSNENDEEDEDSDRSAIQSKQDRNDSKPDDDDSLTPVHAGVGWKTKKKNQ